ncbi:MAG: hypothetical protein KAS67_06850 [Thermoplasmata archaeon]|nr:hypothetical protein [Thermoplasmata archaeon]
MKSDMAKLKKILVIIVMAALLSTSFAIISPIAIAEDMPPVPLVDLPSSPGVTFRDITWHDNGEYAIAVGDNGNIYKYEHEANTWTQVEITNGNGAGDDLSEYANVTGTSTDDLLGFNISYAGDVNNDGNDDTIVGAPGADEAYVFFGGASIIGSLARVDADVILIGSASSGFGWDVASAGNIDGDAYDDIIIGAPADDQAFIFCGSTIFGGGTFGFGVADVAITGENAGDKFGASVNTAGNYDNAGNDDIIIGAPEYDSGKGRAYVFYGDGSIPIAAANADVILSGSVVKGNFGFSVACAGDTDGIAGDEVIVGEPGNDGAYIYYAPTEQTADADVHVSGTVKNDYTWTHTQDGQYEEIVEVGGSSGTLFSDGFESGDLATGGWTVDADPLVSTENVNTGIYSCDLGSANTMTTGSIIKGIDSTGWASIILNYSVATNGLDSGVDYFRAEYDVGSGFVILEELTGTLAYADKSFTLPVSADDNPNLKIRFYLYRDATSEDAYVDDVSVTYSSASSYIEHKWTVDIPERSDCTFNIEANHTANAEGDDFDFYYSTTGLGTVGDTGWIKMVSIIKTSDDDIYQIYTDETLSDFNGVLYIGVIDQDRTEGNTNTDSIYIDHMYIFRVPKKELAGELVTTPTVILANNDLPISGTVNPNPNGYLRTQASDNDYEEIEEVAGLTDSGIAWSDDFETDKGWTGYGGLGEWERAVPAGLGGSTAGHADPSADHTPGAGTMCLGNDLTGLGSNPGDYEDTASTAYWITSPLIDLTGTNNIHLRFHRCLNVQEDTSDMAYIEVKNGISAWTRVWDNIGSAINDYVNRWYPVIYDVSTLADGQGAFQIRFGISSDNANQFSGWNIDDLELVQGTLYNYDFSTGYGIDKWSFEAVDVSALSSYSTNNIPGEVGFTDANIAISNNARRTTAMLTKDAYTYHHFNFTINENPADVAGLYIEWEGYSDDSGAEVSYIWNNTAGTWTFLSSTNYESADKTHSFSGMDGAGHDDPSISNFLDNGYLHFACGGVKLDAPGRSLFTDFVKVQTFVEMPGPTSLLEHKWSFDIPAGEDATLYLEAHHTINSEGDEFEFYYSTNGLGTVGDSNWTQMFSLVKTSDDDNNQSYSDGVLDSFSGILYIGVIDSDRSLANTDLEIIYIDHLYIRVQEIIPTRFGWSVANVGNVNADGAGKSDIIVGAPDIGNGESYLWFDGDYDSLLTRKDETQADFTASGSSLASSNPNNNVFANSWGDLNLTAESYAPEQQDVSQETSNSYATENYWFAEEFVPITSGKLTRISLYFYYGTGTAVPIELHANDNDGMPGGTVLEASTISVSCSGTQTWADASFTYVVTQGDTYFIVLKTGSNIANYCWLFQDSLAIGNAWKSTDSGASWSDTSDLTSPEWSMAFRVWLQPVTYSSTGYYTSSTTTASSYITAVKLYWDLTIPGGTKAWLNISRDGGTTWNQSAITSGLWYAFPSEVPGDELRYKVEMIGNGVLTPILHNLTIECEMWCRDLTFTGESPGDKFGYSVSYAGDIGGGGVDDIIIGAPYNDNGLADAGAIYVFNGSAGLSGTISAADADYRNYSYNAGAHMGWSVAYGMDLNVDTYNDVLAGSPHFDTANSDTGLASIFSLHSFSASSMNLKGTCFDGTKFFIVGDAGPSGYAFTYSEAGGLVKIDDAVVLQDAGINAIASGTNCAIAVGSLSGSGVVYRYNYGTLTWEKLSETPGETYQGITFNGVDKFYMVGYETTNNYPRAYFLNESEDVKYGLDDGSIPAKCMLYDIEWNLNSNFGLACGLDPDPGANGNLFKVTTGGAWYRMIGTGDTDDLRGVSWKSDGSRALVVGYNATHAQMYSMYEGNGFVGRVPDGSNVLAGHQLFAVDNKPLMTKPDYSLAVGASAMKVYFNLFDDSTQIRVVSEYPHIFNVGMWKKSDGIGGLSTLNKQVDVSETYTFFAEVNYSFGAVDEILDGNNNVRINLTAWYDEGKVNTDSEPWSSWTDENRTSIFSAEWEEGPAQAAAMTYPINSPTFNEFGLDSWWLNPGAGDHYNIYFNITLGNQTHTADGQNFGNGAASSLYDKIQALNDPFSWDFSFRIYDVDYPDAENITYEEFGVFRSTNITVSGNPSGNAPPGFNDKFLGSSMVTCSANMPYYTNVSIPRLNMTTDDSKFIPATSVAVNTASSLANDTNTQINSSWTFGRPFSAANEPWGIWGNASMAQAYWIVPAPKNGTTAHGPWGSDYNGYGATMINWYVSVPGGTAEGIYQATITFKIGYY